MTPSITAVRMSGARNRHDLPLLVLGPSLGTSATALWSACAAGLNDVFDVLAWDLPGHGHNRSTPRVESEVADRAGGPAGFTMAELAAGVLVVVDDVLAQRDQIKGPFAYAGDSVGGAVGLQLLLDVPDRVTAAVLLGTGAKIGDAASWAERMGQVRASGTPVMVAGSTERWFAPGFVEREPLVASALLRALVETDDDGYVQVCAALADYDVRDRLHEIAAPVLAVAGALDAVTPPASLAAIADGVRDGELVELPGVAHLAPAEAPTEVAALVRRHVLGEEPLVGDVEGQAEDGLDPRGRSLVTIAALVAGGRSAALTAYVQDPLVHGLRSTEVAAAVALAQALATPTEPLGRTPRTAPAAGE